MKIGWLRAALDLARVEKGEVVPDSAVKKSEFFLFVQKNYSDSQYELGDPTWWHENLSQQIGFVTRFWNEAPKEIKVKINESRLLKFYQENLTERKFNRELYGKEP